MTSIKEKRRELAEFLTNREIKEFRLTIDARKYIVFKIKLTDNVDQLFCCYSYQTQGQKVDEYNNFKSAGYIKDGLYRGNYCLCNILEKLEVPEWNNSFNSLMIEEKIKKYINDYIISNWDYFKKEESSNEEYYKINAAEIMVEDWIIKEKLEEAPDYKYNNSFDFTDEEYVQYLDKGEKFIYSKGNEIVEQFKYSIHNTIVCWELAVKMFNEKKNDPDFIHVRNMKQVLAELNAKTVKIKIVKDNKLPTIITVPVNAIKRCNPKSFISLYINLSKPDRDLFESTYGRRAKLYPEDIDEIIYRNKTIYKKGE